MAGGYTVGIASETKAFRQGLQSGVIQPLEDADDALRDLGNNTAPHKLEQAMRDAQAETKDLASETKKTADTIAREYRDSYRKVDDTSSEAFSKMKDHGAEAGSELRQNFGETVSSFRGDAEDIPQIIQDTFGGLASSLGPAGAVGAGVLAALIGVGTQMVQNWSADTEKMKEAAGEWADKYIESGGRVLSFDQQMSAVRQILTDPDKYKAATDAAHVWGVNNQIAVEALAGMPGGIDAVKGSVDGLKGAYEDALGPGGQMVDEFGNLNGQAAQAHKRYTDAKNKLDELTGAMDMGAQQASIYSDSLRWTAEHAQGATRKVDEFGDTVVSLPDGHQIYIDAETGQATDNVDDIERKIYGLNGKTVPITADTSQIDAAIHRLRQTNIRINGQIVYQTPGGSKLY